MIARYKLLADQYNLIEPLKELVMDGAAEEVLTPEYQQILKNSESIRDQNRKAPVHLNRLCSEFFVDRFSLRRRFFSS